MKFSTFAMATIASLTLAGGANALTNYVSDGMFNSPSGGATFVTYSGGSTMGPWTVTGDSVDLIGGYWQAPTAGGGSVDLDGTAPGGLMQTLTLSPGTYDLTFDLSGNPDGGAPLKTVDVSVGGANAAFTYLTGANTHTSMNYVPESLVFTTTGSTTLSFASQDLSTSAYGPVIGDVSVVTAAAVPEPATWALALLGIGGLGAALRSRRRIALI